MRRNLPVKDLVLLSAYLDGELTPRQKGKLETRLAQEAELSAALAELRQTRLVLRNAPRLRTPRSFTLTPEMAGQRSQSSRWVGRMQLLSALTSILLVVMFVGEVFFAPSMMGRSAAQDVAGQEVAMDSAPAEAAVAEEEMLAEVPLAPAESAADAVVEEPVPAAAPAAEVQGEAEGYAAEDIPADTVDDAAALAEEPQGTQPPPATKDGGGSDGGGGGGEGSGENAAPQAAPTQEPVATLRVVPADDAVGAVADAVTNGDADTDVEAGDVGDGALGAAESDEEAANRAPEQAGEQRAEPVNWVRIFEISLFVIALISGAAAFWLRREMY